MSSSLNDIKESDWQRLAQERIYFGHQSVGSNIIAGIRDIMKENPQIKLNIIETNDPAAFRTPAFVHSRIGKNEAPLSKVGAFARFIEHGAGNKVDIAFFKFCFVDITSTTDVQKVFNDYKTVLAGLKKEYPKTIFIHFTVPLMTVQKDSRAWIKKILGRPIGGYNDNIKRNLFNEMIRNEYRGQDPIFDIALIESTYPDGKRESFTQDGKIFYALAPEYTHDGGHLNEEGRKIVAGQLLILLATISFPSPLTGEG